MINQKQWPDHVKRTSQAGHSTKLPILVKSLYMEDVMEMTTNLGARQNVRRYVVYSVYRLKCILEIKDWCLTQVGSEHASSTLQTKIGDYNIFFSQNFWAKIKIF